MTTRPRLSRAAASTIIAIFAILGLAADQFTKYLAVQHLEPEKAVPVLGDFLQFFLTRNPGAAFSLGEGVTWIFTLALAGVAVTIVVLAVTRITSRRWAFVLGALLGGVAGNLTDRIFQDPGFAVGHVIDFIYTPWMMPAIYNVADIFIVTSMVFVALLILFGVHFDGSVEQKVKAESDTAVAPTDDDDYYETRRERRERMAAENSAPPAATRDESDETEPADGSAVR